MQWTFPSRPHRGSQCPQSAGNSRWPGLYSCYCLSKSSFFPVAQCLMRCIAARCPRHSTPGMRSCPAKIKPIYRGSILRPSWYRPHEEELFQSQVAVKDVALRQPIGSFQIKGGEHLPRQYGVGDVGSILSDLLYDTISEQFAVFIPGALPEVIGNVLYKAGQDVFAGWRKGSIGIRGNHAIDPQFFRDRSELGYVIAVLGKFQGWNERVKGSLQRCSACRGSLESRFFGQHHIHLGAGALHFDSAHRREKICGKVSLIKQAEESSLWVRVREHDAGVKFGSIFQHYAACTTIAYVNVSHRRAGANLDSQLFAGRGHCLRNRSHPSHHVSIETLKFVLASAEQVEEKADRGAWLVRSAMFPVDVVGQKHGLHFLGFIVLIEKLAETASQK